MTHASPYTPPTLTVDAVVFQVGAGGLEVLLHQRPREPFAGEWALPGGYCSQGQTTVDAIMAVTLAKTGVSLDADAQHMEQLYTFDTVARDPRGHAVSVVYMALGTVINCDGAPHNAQFWPVDELPTLAYDHAEIIALARKRLAGKLHYTTIAFGLLPATFTLSDLQQTYEAVLGQPLDKRNFRKKIASLDMIHETGHMQRNGAHRPAKLYAFHQPTLTALHTDF
ncbi:MAG: NUDIX domain-containing protein [Candidatus Saccharibacteria bacterium]|nr:NUDIX domain-containing protein [Candidatus Saccharibacteria bacterium]